MSQACHMGALVLLFGPICRGPKSSRAIVLVLGLIDHLARQD
jgi:hypothetical protein